MTVPNGASPSGWEDDTVSECCLHKHEGLDSDPQTHVNLGMVACSHSAMGQSQVDPGSSLDSHPAKQ